MILIILKSLKEKAKKERKTQKPDKNEKNKTNQIPKFSYLLLEEYIYLKLLSKKKMQIKISK